MKTKIKWNLFDLDSAMQLTAFTAIAYICSYAYLLGKFEVWGIPTSFLSIGVVELLSYWLYTAPILIGGLAYYKIPYLFLRYLPGFKATTIITVMYLTIGMSVFMYLLFGDLYPGWAYIVIPACAILLSILFIAMFSEERIDRLSEDLEDKDGTKKEQMSNIIFWIMLVGVVAGSYTLGSKSIIDQNTFLTMGETDNVIVTYMTKDIIITRQLKSGSNRFEPGYTLIIPDASKPITFYTTQTGRLDWSQWVYIPKKTAQ